MVDHNDDGDADYYGDDDVFSVSAGLNLPTMGLSATCPLASFTILHSGRFKYWLKCAEHYFHHEDNEDEDVDCPRCILVVNYVIIFRNITT